MADYEGEIQNIVDELDDIVSEGVMDDATASRLNDLADGLENLPRSLPIPDSRRESFRWLRLLQSRQPCTR